MNLPALLKEANRSSQEATAIITANADRLEKLPPEVIDRILGMAAASRLKWWMVEQSLESIRAKL